VEVLVGEVMELVRFQEHLVKVILVVQVILKVELTEQLLREEEVREDLGQLLYWESAEQAELE
jgi:hypothetical protein